MELSELMPILWPLLVVQLILMATALLSLRKAAAVRGKKWAWALVIIFVNIIGPIVYFAFARKEE